MRFTVPQFIDVEDKIIGPLTTRQFLIMLVVCGIIFITYKLADFVLFIVAGLGELSLGIVFAFLKINGQPFHYFLLNMFQTLSKPRLRSWNKEHSDAELRDILSAPPPPPPAKRVIKERISTSRLSDLSLVVNTGGVYNPEEQ